MAKRRIVKFIKNLFNFKKEKEFSKPITFTVVDVNVDGKPYVEFSEEQIELIKLQFIEALKEIRDERKKD